MKFAVTLKDLRGKRACFEEYNRLVLSLQGKEFSEKYQDRESYIKCSHNGLIPIEYILSSNGIDDALWALRCVKDADRDLRLFAVWCARQVQHLMNDERSINALDVSERFANGQASESERASAWAAARAAAGAAAWDAAWDAARAAQAEMLIKMCRGEAPWQVAVEAFV